MRLLLDTHCWLWMVGRADRLSKSSRALLEDQGNELLLSAASSWEIAISTPSASFARRAIRRTSFRSGWRARVSPHFPCIMDTR